MNSQKSNKRIALITTWYPPITGIAVSRMDSFANYLSEDFTVEVFCLGDKKETIKKSKSLIVHYITSNNLFNKLKSNQKDFKIIHNFKTVLRILLKKVIKSPLNSWKNDTLFDLKRIHEKEPFDLIISSFSPSESHVVASEFCQIHSSVPWIADMRDEMSTNPTIDGITKSNLHNIENLVNKYASAITSVSEPILNDFKLICPKVSLFEEVRNGYNHLLVNQNLNSLNNSTFTFGFFGSFYGAVKPDLFFEALMKILLSVPEFDFQFEVYGAHKNFNIPTKLKNKVHIFPHLPYEKAILKMQKMDVNVLFIPNNGRKGIYSGKLFDYISVQRPIFAMLDKKDVAFDLIKELNCGYLAEFNDIDEIVDAIKKIIKDKTEGVFDVASTSQVESLHRRNQVQKLKTLINNLISK